MCKKFKLKNFSGVFMRNEVKSSATNNECFVMNIDHSSNDGTHWTCLYVKNRVCYYFDSYGIAPPEEIIRYCDGFERYYNSFKIQKVGEVICGHYCIYMLHMLDTGIDFYDALSLIKK